MYSLKTKVKNALLPDGKAPRTILTGAFRGIRMNLNLRTQTQLFLGLYEKETHGWLKRLSEGVETAIDIGVAEGEHLLFFLKKTKAATVLAFEGDSECLGVLEQNLKLNGLEKSGRLDLIQRYVSDVGPAAILDDFVGRVQCPCVIKMDVDGWEVHILNGAKALNALPQVRWLIEVHSRKLEEGCLEILKAAGFQTRIIPYKWWRGLLPIMTRTQEGACALNRQDIRWLAAWKP